jgi:hypothetical protein
MAKSLSRFSPDHSKVDGSRDEAAHQLGFIWCHAEMERDDLNAVSPFLAVTEQGKLAGFDGTGGAIHN